MGVIPRPQQIADDYMQRRKLYQYANVQSSRVPAPLFQIELVTFKSLAAEWGMVEAMRHYS